jgi:hypothetical protein
MHMVIERRSLTSFEQQQQQQQNGSSVAVFLYSNASNTKMKLYSVKVSNRELGISLLLTFAFYAVERSLQMRTAFRSLCPHPPEFGHENM